LGSEGEKMKKYLALVVGVLFTLGFAVSAFAIQAEIPPDTQAVVAKGATKITLGGDLRFRGELRYNLDLDSGQGESKDTDAVYDTRVQIRMQADVSKNTQGVIQLQSGQRQPNSDTLLGFGGVTTSNNPNAENKFYAGGTDADSGTKGMYRKGDAKRGALTIRQAWLLHKGSGLLGIPASIKIGHMPLRIGDGLFFSHLKYGDDAIILSITPTKELNISLQTIKLAENDRISADDADLHVALINYKSGKTSLGADFSYLDDQREGINSSGETPSTSGTPNNQGTHLYNVGLRAKTEVGGFGINADLELQGGKSKYETAADIAHKGYAYLVGASYKVNGTKLSLEHAFGSGDDSATDDKNNTFVNSLSIAPKDQGYSLVYNYRTTPATGLDIGTGLANTTYIKLGANTNLTKDLNANLSFYILQAAKKKSIRSTQGGGTAGVTKGDSKKIGRELDAIVTYKIDKNLNYYVEGGYLWTGAFWDQATVPADDAYMVRHGLLLSF
jgi:hypothetical protein